MLSRQDAIVLQQNHSIYDLPKGIVVEMFSNEFCTGDATLVPQVQLSVRRARLHITLSL
jgi:hypothetical protein